jgi:hypothetical protein
MDALDGPIAAPHHHTVMFENEHVRVLETVIAAGDTAPLHSHLAKHLMLVNSGSHFVRRDADGTVLLDTRAMEPPFAMPSMLWSDGNPAHTLENTGDDEIRITAVELKG